MRIAIVTDDGETVSGHFGRARLYAVLDVEDGLVVSRELRAKPAPHWQTGAGGRHGSERPDNNDPATHARHDQMAAAIADCDFVVGRGMGSGARSHLVTAGLRPIVTDLGTVEEAALACAAGTIVDRPESCGGERTLTGARHSVN